ncbi:hypothetical protein ANAEL_02656 [Anaerolineales bacterium]|nr:hypothetical protein ANAEL_02656 [Anaerolineales bacterium]
MQAKLTLSLEKEVIEQAKEFSRRQHKSLSKMVENYLRLVTGTESGTEEITPVVGRLMGAVSMDVKDKGRKEITAYLEEKYK